MNFWIKLVLVMMIGSFPFTIYYYSIFAPLKNKKQRRTNNTNQSHQKSEDFAMVEIKRGINSKAKELREIEVRILQNKGSILKLEEDKQTFVNNLEALQGQISGVIQNVRGGRTVKTPD